MDKKPPPVRNNSIGIVFTAPPKFISDAVDGRYLFPQFEIAYQHRICNRAWLSAGIIYPYHSSFNYFPSIIKYRLANIQLRAGIDFKLKLYRRFYFSPSLDFYFTNERYPNFYHPAQPGFKQTVYSIGPDINFEYYFRRNFSIDMSLLALSYGIEFPLSKFSNGNFFNNNGYAQVHRALSLGVHYNFGYYRKKNSTK